MNKIIKSLLISIFTLFLFAGSTFAVGYSTSVRLQNPSSPTNQDTFGITFVALDTNLNQTVNVNCYKKAPGDAGFSVFQSFSLANGGNTETCQVTSGIMNKGNGTYDFYITAIGSTNVTSSTVYVNFNTDKPGQPVNYNKTKSDNCTYKIEFRTANDSGKTVKVALYRSSDRNFTLDSGHQVNTVSIGSDTNGSMTDNINPNCSTEYFYAIRAFDTYGNPSDPNGDSSTTTTVINPTSTAQGLQGAIPRGTGDNILSSEGLEGTSKGVLGTESGKINESDVNVNNNKNPISSLTNWIMTHKKIDLMVLVITAAVAYFLLKKYKKI